MINSNAKKGQLKAADYDSDVCAVLKTAIEIYCTILLMENLFPTSVQEVDWAKNAWSLAGHHHNIKLTHDGGILKLIVAQRTHIHGQFKLKAHPIITTTFSFKMSADKGVQTRNCLLVNDGIKWGKYHNPFPQVAFALVLTVEDDYLGVFNSHLTSLDEFSKVAGDLDLLKKLLEQVYSTRCIHAGVTAKNTKEQKKAILSCAFLNAIHNYQMADDNDCIRLPYCYCNCLI
ncbi:hypothetical protein EDC04DRAFT_2606585 [Pisolithus marmoratus]|nr:hypothetical protein EDC04DRAFT_2606585 [Pisolithus marmoratus]